MREGWRMRVALRSFSAAWAIRGVLGVRCWKRRSRALVGDSTSRSRASEAAGASEITSSEGVES